MRKRYTLLLYLFLVVTLGESIRYLPNICTT